MKTRTCTKCKQEKEATLDNFPPRSNRKSGFRSECRVCHRARVKDARQKKLDFLNEYKSSRGCRDCGITDPRVLDLHHVDGNGLGVGFAMVSMKRILEEVEKCIVLCRNHHALEHYEMGFNNGRQRIHDQERLEAT